jgi:hypothetical protein
MIIGTIGIELPPQVPFIYDDDVVQALPPYGADNSLDIWIKPNPEYTLVGATAESLVIAAGHHCQLLAEGRAGTIKSK